jgi:hypothetical protein
MFLVPDENVRGALAFHDAGVPVLTEVDRKVKAPVEVDGQASTVSDAVALADPTTWPAQVPLLVRA